MLYDGDDHDHHCHRTHFYVRSTDIFKLDDSKEKVLVGSILWPHDLHKANCTGRH
jgi:hypothetical protein